MKVVLTNSVEGAFFPQSDIRIQLQDAMMWCYEFSLLLFFRHFVCLLISLFFF